MWKNDRGVMGRLRVKPGGWVWKCAQEYPGVEDGNSLKSTPGWRSSPPARLRGRHGCREAESRVGCGWGGWVFRQDAAGLRLPR